MATITGSLGDTAQDDIVIDFGDIAAGDTETFLRSWNLACARADAVATYSILATTDSTASTDSLISVEGEDDVPR